MKTWQARLEDARGVLTAQERIYEGWSHGDHERALDACPPCVHAQGYTAQEWTVTVERFRRPDEDVVAAAERLALYVTLHAERYAQPPRLKVINPEPWDEPAPRS